MPIPSYTEAPAHLHTAAARVANIDGPLALVTWWSGRGYYLPASEVHTPTLDRWNALTQANDPEAGNFKSANHHAIMAEAAALDRAKQIEQRAAEWISDAEQAELDAARRRAEARARSVYVATRAAELEAEHVAAQKAQFTREAEQEWNLRVAARTRS